MKLRPPPLPPDAARFRVRLMVALLAVVVALSAAGLVVARRSIAAQEQKSFEQQFQAALATLHQVQELRHAALVERCRALARKPRIHAALEDGALDLLYLSARDELRDAIATGVEPREPSIGYTLRARFYRFLDQSGQVLPPPSDDDAFGLLPSDEEARITLPALSDRSQTGYLAGSGTITEIIATPIISIETGEPIAALVLGFDPVRIRSDHTALPGMMSGVWANGQLSLPSLSPSAARAVRDALQRPTAPDGNRFPVDLDGEPHLVFTKQLNPGSLLPAGYEICVFPLAEMHARQRRVTGQILGAGGVLLLVGFIVSHQLAGRFARPVAMLAHDSQEQRTQRHRAEAALESTSAELERVARFSADASHQLKTPVTVLRAGLEEMLARGTIPATEVEEVSHLIHQTFRLSTVIEDLLLLSRLDAGQLKIHFGTVDLAHLIEASLDDLSASPDEFDLAIESDFPHPLVVAGEKRFIALILQNLLENARKYNRPGGRIRIGAHAESGMTTVTIGNTTRRPIPREAQPHIFERFHRGAAGENVPGYGIGLNLARELARLHDGELRLMCSDNDWTEFEVRLRTLETTPPNPS